MRTRVAKIEEVTYFGQISLFGWCYCSGGEVKNFSANDYEDDLCFDDSPIMGDFEFG